MYVTMFPVGFTEPNVRRGEDFSRQHSGSASSTNSGAARGGDDEPVTLEAVEEWFSGWCVEGCVPFYRNPERF